MLQLFLMYVFQLRLTKQDNYTVSQYKATFLFYTNLYAMLRMRVMLTSLCLKDQNALTPIH